MRTDDNHTGAATAAVDDPRIQATPRAQPVDDVVAEEDTGGVLGRWDRIIVRWGSALLLRVRTEGLEHVPSRGGALLVANHPSPGDAWIFAGILPRRQLLGTALAFLLATTAVSRAEDWPMMGRDRTRNPVSPEKGAPVDWDFSSGRNIKWRAKLGSMAFGDPVVARGLVWIGTNNSNPRDPRFLGEGAVLMCFRESDGEFLYQFVVPAQPGPLFRVSRLGFNGSPLVEGERMWLTTLAGEVLCLDLPDLLRGGMAPAEVWKVHLPDEYGVIPHYAFMGDARTCSLSTSYRDRLYVITGNGAGPGYTDVPAPLAPSVLCLDRNSGKALWEDASPGRNIVRGQWASPLVVEIDGRGQVIAPQGDGWVRSFDALTGHLIWKLDINPKSVTNRWMRNHFLNAPVLYQGRVYIGGGQSMEEGEGPGRLFCIDPRKTGDLSLELEDGPGQGRPNPASGVIWSFAGFNRTRSLVAVHDGLVTAVDFSGFIYCLDAATGREYWRHDTRAKIYGSPMIVEGKVYVGTGEGDVFILALGREKSLIARHRITSAAGAFTSSIRSSPIFANGALYIANQEMLYAIQAN